MAASAGSLQLRYPTALDLPTKPGSKAKHGRATRNRAQSAGGGSGATGGGHGKNGGGHRGDRSTSVQRKAAEEADSVSIDRKVFRKLRRRRPTPARVEASSGAQGARRPASAGPALASDFGGSSASASTTAPGSGSLGTLGSRVHLRRGDVDHGHEARPWEAYGALQTSLQSRREETSWADSAQELKELEAWVARQEGGLGAAWPAPVAAWDDGNAGAVHRGEFVHPEGHLDAQFGNSGGGYPLHGSLATGHHHAGSASSVGWPAAGHDGYGGNLRAEGGAGFWEHGISEEVSLRESNSCPAFQSHRLQSNTPLDRGGQFVPHPEAWLASPSRTPPWSRGQAMSSSTPPKRRAPRSDPVSRGAEMRATWGQDRFLQNSPARKFDLRSCGTPEGKGQMRRGSSLLIANYSPPHDKRQDAYRGQIYQNLLVKDLLAH